MMVVYEKVMMTKDRASCLGFANATSRHDKTTGTIQTQGEQEQNLLPVSPGGVDPTDVGPKTFFFRVAGGGEGLAVTVLMRQAAEGLGVADKRLIHNESCLISMNTNGSGR